MWYFMHDYKLVFVSCNVLITLTFYGQLLDEVKGALDFLEFAYGVFGFTFQLELSTVHDIFTGLLISNFLNPSCCFYLVSTEVQIFLRYNLDFVLLSIVLQFLL